MSVEIRGAAETRRAMMRVAVELSGRDVVDALQWATLTVMRSAREGVPVDTGRLRNSITGAVEVTRDNTVRGVVGSNLAYAPYVETGTRPHRPPLSALLVWARRHGVSPYAVQLSIMMRGTPPVYYLRNAMDKHRAAIKARIGGAVSTIIETHGGSKPS